MYSNPIGYFCCLCLKCKHQYCVNSVIDYTLVIWHVGHSFIGCESRGASGYLACGIPYQIHSDGSANQISREQNWLLLPAWWDLKGNHKNSKLFWLHPHIYPIRSALTAGGRSHFCLCTIWLVQPKCLLQPAVRGELMENWLPVLRQDWRPPLLRCRWQKPPVS